jgi:ferredoxin
MKKIIHERKKCIGCGTCASICPGFFAMDKTDGLANLKDSKQSGDHFELLVDDLECVGDAAMLCPTKVIWIEEVGE